MLEGNFSAGGGLFAPSETCGLEGAIPGRLLPCPTFLASLINQNLAIAAPCSISMTLSDDSVTGKY